MWVTEQRETHFGWRKSIVFSVVLIAAFFGLAELLVRGWSYFLREEAIKFDLATQTFTLVPGEHRNLYVTATINSDGFVGKELEPKGDDLWRVVAVGDSCTYGGGGKTDNYPAMLDLMLDQREQPGLRYEVVNAGISGLNSELALRRLRSKVLELEPDVVTIYLGWNDLMKVDPLSQGEAKEWSGLARMIDGLWLIKGMRKLLFFYIRPNVWIPKTGTESRTGRFASFEPSFFELNLREMIEAVREIGSRPVLVTLPTVVRPDMTTTDLKQAGVIFPYFQSAYGVGDLLDLIAAYNRVIRRVAAEEEVPLVDLSRTFENLEDTPRYFSDTMHLSNLGLETVAKEILAGLERNDLLGRAIQNDPSSGLEAASRVRSIPK
jgi:lysophospholipase L1-like esterase